MPMYKIAIKLEPRLLKDGTMWPGFEVETVWADRVTESTYRIDNVPFFADCVNYGDIVSVEGGDDSGELNAGDGVLRFGVDPFSWTSS